MAIAAHGEPICVLIIDNDIFLSADGMKQFTPKNKTMYERKGGWWPAIV